MNSIRHTHLFLFFALILAFSPKPFSYAGQAQDLLAQAYTAYQHNQWSSAKAPLLRAIHLYPNYAEAHHLLGLVLTQLHQPEEAIAALQQSVKAYPSFAQAYVDLGFVFQDQGKFEQAEQAFRQASTIYPNYLESWTALAALFDQQQQATKAIEAHRKVLEIAPHQADSLYGLAFWFVQQGNLEQAQPYVEQLTTQNPGHINGWLMTGSLAQQANQTEQASHAYQQGITLQQKLVDPYFNRGIL
jgi:tetratricopeptide (TPR) repeat protein